MNKMLWNYALLLVLLVGCKNPAEPPKQSELAADYMPLQIGNIWYYKEYEPGQRIDTLKEVLTIQVAGQKMIDNQSYFILQEQSLDTTEAPQFRTIDTFYYRCDGPKLYIGQNDYNVFKIIVAADFSMNVNDSYELSYDRGLAGVTNLVISLIEKESQYLIFSYDFPVVSDASYYRTYKYKAGIFDQSSFGGWGMRLSRCELK